MHDSFRFEDGPDQATRSLVHRGELDGACAGDVRNGVDQALAAGKRRVIVDLSETTYMETPALAALLDANARVRRFGAAFLVVVPVDSRVRQLFRVTRLDKVLRILETREAAIGAL